jgi:hypothetical protein
MSALNNIARHLTLVLLISGATLTSAAAQSWTKSTWRQFGFSAEFPGKPRLDSSVVAEPDSRTMMMVATGSKSGYFAVMITEMPEFTAEAIDDSARREMILDGAQDQSLADANATLKSQRAISLGGRYGREIIAALPDGEAEVHSRIYLEENRMYMQIAVVANRKAIATGTRFLKSFRFL